MEIQVFGVCSSALAFQLAEEGSIDTEKDQPARNTLLTHVWGLSSETGTAIPWTFLFCIPVNGLAGNPPPWQREVKTSFHSRPTGNKGIFWGKTLPFPFKAPPSLTQSER